MEDNTQEPAGFSVLEEHLEDRKQYALKLLKEILNRLWVGNGAGVVTILTALKPQQHNMYLAPLSCFIIGLVVLGIGAFSDLHWVRGELQDIENALKQGGENPILHQHGQFFPAPSRQVRLKWTDWAAIAVFVAGVVAGFGAAFFYILH